MHFFFFVSNPRFFSEALNLAFHSPGLGRLCLHCARSLLGTRWKTGGPGTGLTQPCSSAKVAVVSSGGACLGFTFGTQAGGFMQRRWQTRMLKEPEKSLSDT